MAAFSVSSSKAVHMQTFSKVSTRTAAPVKLGVSSKSLAAPARPANVLSRKSLKCSAEMIKPTAEEVAFPWRAGQAQASAGAAPPRGDVMGDAMGLLLKERIVFLGSQVDDFSADAVISQLLLLDAQDPTKDIKLFINSPGGSVTAGMGIYDAMQMCRCDVSTVCFGLAASMGAFLLAGGTKGKRYSMPNARIMIHQPLGGASGQAVDIEIQAREIMHHKANLNRILAYHTGQDVVTVDEDTDRDRYMSPLEAKAYGLIDEIIGGDEATKVVEGDVTALNKTKQAYIAWGNDDDDDGSSSDRFLAKSRIEKSDVPKAL
eukprot:CAMPEP_0197866328 /NCGR_PEP_ID=MMETSP1438-20131217/44156_1 /TAXON_ID=1461541 /ORGANISM="Pterosperma sp., Strain CCMP1384" /LENGTH=317 /DNA_ID=CAMNT_0043484887 /DNA_START=51 /DNA_END=1004 /DNA_ORIENTATION=-